MKELGFNYFADPYLEVYGKYPGNFIE